MSSLDDIQRRLVVSELLTEDQAAKHLAQWREETVAWQNVPPDDFMDWLIQRGEVNEFQGDAILAGHTGPFRLGPYEVHEHIAFGLLGGIYRAVQTEFKQPVSLKIFPPSLHNDPEKVARMGREARIFAELDHPNVARSYQVGKAGEFYFMALEDLRGETLADRLLRVKRLRYKLACRIGRDIARGLSHLHENEVLHRDLQPYNIWLTEGGSPKLTEFGAARDAMAFADALESETDVTSDETVIGDYRYMAPEQAYDLRAADARSDIYALGCVLYHCLTGRPPFVDANPVKLVLKHVNDAPQPPDELFGDIPRQIGETLAGMMAKQPAERFQTATEVAFALDQYLDPDDEPASIEVVHVNQEYIKWANSQRPTEPHELPKDAVGVTPELTEFLNWMSARRRRKRRPRR